MRKCLILAAALTTLTSGAANAQGFWGGRRGGADVWAQGHDNMLCANDEGCNGQDGNPPRWMRGGYYGGQGYGGWGAYTPNYGGGYGQSYNWGVQYQWGGYYYQSSPRLVFHGWQVCDPYGRCWIEGAQ